MLFRFFALALLLILSSRQSSQEQLSDIRLCRDAAMAIPKPTNGQVLACCRYSKLKFRCFPGYKLDRGDEEVTCRRGRIYGSFPRCIVAQQQTCGKSFFILDKGRVVGGSRSSPTHWPWMAAIHLDGSLKCGGTLISDTHILTAAHCCYDFSGTHISNPSRFSVLLGATDLLKKGDKSRTVSIKRIWVHQQFSLQTFKNDIAVLEMSESVRFSRHLRPICFPGNETELATPGRQSYIAGWGRTAQQSRAHSTGRTSNELRHADMPVADNSSCTAATRPGEPYDEKTMLCAGTGKGGVDACHGDSGGPLMVHDPYTTKKGAAKNKWTIVGVVSWGDGCAMPGTYGYYTRISTFVDWVKDKMKQ